MSRTLLKNIALLMITVGLSLVLGEYVLRFAFRDITTTSDNRSYFALKWKKDNVRLNSLGFREREFDRGSQPGIYRIAVIGDSYAFGQGIDESDRMSNIIESELRRRRTGVEVLNFGNPGNSTSDESRVLKTVMSSAAPDFVLVQWFVNDVEVPRPNSGAAGEPQTRSRWNRLKMSMRNQSVLYFLMAEVYHRALESWGYGYVDDMQKGFGDPQSPRSLAAEQALDDLFRIARASGVKWGMVLVPHAAPLNGQEYRFGYLHERVLAKCRRDGVVCVDLLETFTPYLSDSTSAMRLWVNRFDPHMAPLANQLAAKRLLEVFGPGWSQEQ